MRNLIIPLAVGLMCTSFTIIPTAPETGNLSVTTVISPSLLTDSVMTTDAAVQVYDQARLQQHGLSREAFNYAWKGYRELCSRNAVSRTEYLTICDFSQSSRQKRLYIIDVETGELLVNTYVAHGKNSGTDYAVKFSNTPESLQSSLGFFVTASTYYGAHGLSLRVKGMEPGINDKAFERSIVIHGANYVDGARARAGIMMGRSWGCPAVPEKESANIIETIKNGTCLFIYHPARNYLLSSKLLND